MYLFFHSYVNCFAIVVLWTKVINPLWLSDCGLSYSCILSLAIWRTLIICSKRQCELYPVTHKPETIVALPTNLKQLWAIPSSKQTTFLYTNIFLLHVNLGYILSIYNKYGSYDNVQVVALVSSNSVKTKNCLFIHSQWRKTTYDAPTFTCISFSCRLLVSILWIKQTKDMVLEKI